VNDKIGLEPAIAWPFLRRRWPPGAASPGRYRQRSTVWKHVAARGGSDAERVLPL